MASQVSTAAVPCVIDVPDALDLSSIGTLEQQVRAARLAGHADLVIDLSHATLIDSVGLRVLMTLRNEAHRAGRSLRLRPGPPQVQRVFDITGTSGLFDWIRV